MITGAAKVAGVVGWPVKHSLSPLIHNAWIDALGLDAAYVPLPVGPEGFAALVDGFRGGAIAGLNVTLPHKLEALVLGDVRSQVAEDAGAANLLLFEADGTVRADNTDGRGLLEALGRSGWRAERGPVLVLGAGGAAQGAVSALLAAGVPEVRIAARRAEAAEALAARWPGRAGSFGFDRLDRAQADVSAVVNATSAGLNGVGELPPLSETRGEVVFMDMVYSPLRTAFLRRAQGRGHRTVDGLAMLIGQARPSFEAFFGVAPPSEQVVDVRTLCLQALGEGPALPRSGGAVDREADD